MDARHFCPDCGSIDLIITNEELRDAEGKSLARVECPNCGFRGPISATIGAVTQQQFWDAERVGEVMMRTLAIHGAGPLVQCLEFIGLLPRKRAKMEFRGPKDYEPGSPQMQAKALYDDPSTPKWNEAAQRARDAVMRRIMEAAITAGFEEAERANRIFAIETETDTHPIFKEDDVREFGGDGGVTNIKKARKRRKP